VGGGARHVRVLEEVLPTQFGGSPMAAGLEHLRRELHAALWSSTAIPLAGTPLFWWWQLIEESNLYAEYTAIARFLQGTDPRNPAMKPVAPVLRFEEEGDDKVGDRLQVVSMSSGTNAIGWIYVPAAFSQRVMPDRAVRAGFAFSYPALDPAFASLLEPGHIRR
jgi:hypothetical protein